MSRDSSNGRRSQHLVEPEALTFIEQFARPPLSRQALADLRAFAKNLFRDTPRSPPAGVAVRKELARSVDGGPDIPLWVYAPESFSSPRSALLHIHGGGYVAGSPEAEADWSEWLVQQLGCVVVAPEYRLAPETVYPGSLMDCYSALSWLHDKSESLHVDAQRIGVFGGSAGGGLAAAVALTARDRHQIPLCTQCLLYPMLDDRTGATAAVNPFAGEYVWTSADNAFGWGSLLGHEPGRPDVVAYAAPARAKNLEGLPATYIWVGALDLFVDESIDYARRLLQAGVSTELHVYPGVTHGNILMPTAPSTQVCREEILRALKRNLKLLG